MNPRKAPKSKESLVLAVGPQSNFERESGREDARHRIAKSIDFRASLFILKANAFYEWKTGSLYKSSRSRIVSRMRFFLAQILARGRTRLRLI
jgi:hypothetical protein